MTNKKVDILLRAILYFIPFFIGIYMMVVYKGQGQDGYTALVTFMTDFVSWFEDVTIFTGFMSWLKTYITFDVFILNYIFVYMFYICLCEFAILFKNVMVYIFKICNKFLEKGVHIGE